eukprot:SAG31_NODE_1988_length_6721_cov_11.339928_11_plen_32_part_01
MLKLWILTESSEMKAVRISIQTIEPQSPRTAS